MSDTKDKQTSGKLVTSLAAGVALGAATVYLSDKKNQKKVAKKLEDVRAWSDKTVTQWKEKSDEFKDDTQKLAGKAEKELKDTIDGIEKEVKTEENLEKSTKAD